MCTPVLYSISSDVMCDLLIIILENKISCCATVVLRNVSLWLALIRSTRKTRAAIDCVKMGRRKSKRKPPPKKRMTGALDTLFTCPFCNHEKSCEVKM